MRPSPATSGRKRVPDRRPCVQSSWVLGARVTGTREELEEAESGSSAEREGEKAFLHECARVPVSRVCMSLAEHVYVCVCVQARECGQVYPSVCACACAGTRVWAMTQSSHRCSQIPRPESHRWWTKISYGNSGTTQQNQYSNQIAFIDNVSCKKGFN